MVANSWTEPELAIVRTKAADGWSASLIAEALAPFPHGRSRNSVISVCNRLGIELRGSRADSRHVVAARVENGRARARATTPKPQPASSPPVAPFSPTAKGRASKIEMARLRSAEPDAPALVAAPPRSRSALLNSGPSSVPLVDLQPRACRFPVGHDTGADQLFCGCDRETLEANRFYCAAHRRLASAAKATVAA